MYNQVLSSGTLVAKDGVEQVDPKTKALAILDNKCNSCHRIEYKRRIFTLKNMDKHAKKIHKQVFVLKLMPKPIGPQLTKIEYDQLKTWLAPHINK